MDKIALILVIIGALNWLAWLMLVCFFILRPSFAMQSLNSSCQAYFLACRVLPTVTLASIGILAFLICLG